MICAPAHHFVLDASASGKFVRSDERDLHAFHIQIRDAIVAEGGNTHSLDRFDGVGVALVAVVARMIVRERCGIDVARLEYLGVFARCFEREGLIGARSGIGKGAFHVHDRGIVVCEDASHVREEIGGVAHFVVFCVEAGRAIEALVGAECAISREGKRDRLAFRGSFVRGSKRSFVVRFA